MRCSPLRSSRAREQVLSSPISAPRKNHAFHNHTRIYPFVLSLFYLHSGFGAHHIEMLVITTSPFPPPLGSLKIAGRINAFEI